MHPALCPRRRHHVPHEQAQVLPGLELALIHTAVLQLERQLKKQVQEDIEAAKKSEYPPIQDLWNNIYQNPLGIKLRNIDTTKDKIQLPEGIGAKH